ncbi:MAG: glutathione peroxidase [Mycoplasma sp.]
MNLYDFKVLDNKGNVVDLSTYKGKVVLIVNTATRCMYTKQYTELEILFEKYSTNGFVILDFPCNQFMNQAPEADHEINSFCVINYKTKFDRFSKIDVKGNNQSSLFKYLIDNSPTKTGKNIKWNFTKFLIDRNGDIVDRFEPSDKPLKFESSIVKEVNKE